MVGLVLVLGAVLGGPGVTAQAALEQLAEREGLSLIACDLPAEPLYTGEVGELYATLDAVAAECHLETAVYRGILLARPDPGGTLRERLEAALTERERELLLRDEGDLDTVPPLWWELPVRCAEDIIRGDQSAEAYARAFETAAWMAAPALADIIEWSDALAGKRVTLRIGPVAELRFLTLPGAGYENPDGWQALLCVVPLLDPTPYSMNLKHRFTLGPGGELREKADTVIEGSQLKSKRDPRESLPEPMAHSGVKVSLDFAGGASALGEGIASEFAAPGTYRVVLRGAWADDAARALALVGGAAFEDAEDGPHPVAEPGARDRVRAALPLRLRATAALTDAERDVLRYETQRAFWSELPEADRERLRAPCTRERDLSPQAQTLVRRVFAPERAQEASWLLRALPRYGEPVRLWLELPADGKRGQYHLIAPTRVETIGGYAYARIRYPARPAAQDEDLPWGEE